MSADTPWASDVPISLPEPIVGNELRVDMGDFVFTPSGLRHNVTQNDLDESFNPTFAPPPDAS